MFTTKLTEQQRELRKREKWLKTSKRNEKVRDTLKSVGSAVTSKARSVFKKKPTEEKELAKRERWLKSSRKKEKIVNSINNFKDNHLTIKVSPVKDYDFSKKETTREYDFSNFETAVKEAKASKVGIKTEEKKTKNIKINTDKFKDVLGSGKKFAIDCKNKIVGKFSKTPRIEDKTMAQVSSIKNLKIAKVTCGTILATTAIITLCKYNYHLSTINSIIFATALNVGLYTLFDGIFEEEKETYKVKRFSNLSSIK